MNIKKIAISAIALGIILPGVSVFAESNDDVRIPDSPNVGSVARVVEQEENMSKNLYLNSETRLKARASQLIRERINSLQSNKNAIDASNSLTAAQKTALGGIVSTNIAGLTALNATIASSTNATSTKELVNSIYSNFRIYGIVIPKLRLEKRIYDLQNHSQKLSDTFLKVQAKIDEYKAKGKDVTTWQKSLDDAKVLVANDMNTLANLFTKVDALKPTDYGTTSKMVIDQANLDLKNVMKDFNSIKRTLHKPVLKARSEEGGRGMPLGGGTTTASTSAGLMLHIHH